jgi:hypothetical protein
MFACVLYQCGDGGRAERDSLQCFGPCPTSNDSPASQARYGNKRGHDGKPLAGTRDISSWAALEPQSHLEFLCRADRAFSSPAGSPAETCLGPLRVCRGNLPSSSSPARTGFPGFASSWRPGLGWPAHAELTPHGVAIIWAPDIFARRVLTGLQAQVSRLLPSKRTPPANPLFSPFASQMQLYQATDTCNPQIMCRSLEPSTTSIGHDDDAGMISRLR